MPDKHAMPTSNGSLLNDNSHVRLELDRELADAFTAFDMAVHALHRLVDVSPMDRDRIREALQNVNRQTDSALDSLRRRSSLACRRRIRGIERGIDPRVPDTREP